jgi:hypothetical protein
MFSVVREPVPDDALLKTYRGGLRPERWVFRVERLILRALIGTPSSDSEARALADGSSAFFAVWYVGERTATQLLMCDSQVLLHAAKVGVDESARGGLN